MILAKQVQYLFLLTSAQLLNLDDTHSYHRPVVAKTRTRDIFQCPLTCKCRSDLVLCESMKLTSFSMEEISYPKDTSYLSFKNNQLNSIKTSHFSNNLENLRRLKLLDLSKNDLKFIEEPAFRQLRSLRKLVLQANELATLPKKTFHVQSEAQTHRPVWK